MTTILDGKKTATLLEEKLKKKVEKIDGRPPCLVVFLLGENPASQIYVQNKMRACKRVGVHSLVHTFPGTMKEVELVTHIEQANNNPSVDGILVQMPLPPHIDPQTIIHAVSPEKDVDGFHPINVGKLLLEEPGGFVSCTPLGIQTLLAAYSIELEGKHVVILGRSAIVGKPLAALLLQKKANATVTVVHSRTVDPKRFCRQADILIAAIGVPHFVTENDVQEGAVVVDVGINQEADPLHKKGYRLVGDVDFASVKNKCAAITPVPGGVGPMTIAMLLQNTLNSYENSRG